MSELLRTGALRRASAMVGAGAALAGAGFGFVPAASAAAPRATPAVQSVSLQSSQTKVTSSTSQKLRVRVVSNKSEAQFPGEPTSSDVTVALSNGITAQSEVHTWTFTLDSSALTVDDTGAGTLNVPSSAISPYGTIDLTITPIGSPTTTSCQGTPTSKTQKVSLDGTFFFDSRSAGSHKWGMVGKKSGKFTFSATNTVIWAYANTNPGACFNLNNVPCQASLSWQSGPGQGAFLFGAREGTIGSILATRTTNLSTPTGALRVDQAFGTSKKLVLVRNGQTGSLTVKANGNSSGSAKLTGKTHSKPSSQHCKQSGKTRTETSTSWTNAPYKNRSTPLAVHAQIFGAIKVPNNSQGSIIKTSIT